ncbi:MAG: hypothetical protein K8823_1438 [Cenarchaeum symbiont of Oopsacas minuta]|nr:hypothetical protein [Cenarchaeum symbiont of Oopsacas minuta]
MIGIDEMNQILGFVSKRWEEMSTNPKNRAMESLPSNFWMNSVGGKAGTGRWITAIMYTESEADAHAFKEVLLRWQTKGMETTKAPDLIQIGNGKKN